MHPSFRSFHSAPTHSCASHLCEMCFVEVVEDDPQDSDADNDEAASTQKETKKEEEEEVEEDASQKGDDDDGDQQQDDDIPPKVQVKDRGIEGRLLGQAVKLPTKGKGVQGN